jgi:8-oxo-dGTP diphosphatase
MKSGGMIACKNRLTGETKQVSANQLIFRPSAYGIIIKDDKVLLNQAWDGYDFPGGGIEKGETIHDGLLREIKEETGLTAKVGRLLFAGEDFFIANFKANTYFHALVYYFLCTDPAGEISTAGFAEYEKEYMKESIWLPIEDVGALTFYNSVDSLALVQEALRNV